MNTFYKNIFLFYSKKNIVLWASFLTYISVLSAAPFFYFLVLISTHLPFMHIKIQRLKDLITDILPAYSHEFNKYLSMFLSHIQTLELINTIILSLSIFSLVITFLKSVDNIWDVDKMKNIFYEIFRVMSSILLLFLSISITLLFSIIIPLFIPQFTHKAYNFALPFFIWFIIITVLFKVTIEKKVKWKFLLIGSLATTMFVFLLKNILSFYFSLFTYNKVYGSVSIVPALLIWLFIFWNIILFGVVLTKYIYDKKLEK